MAGWIEALAEGELIEQPLLRIVVEEGRPEAELSGVAFEVDRVTGCDAYEQGKRVRGGGEGTNAIIIGNPFIYTKIII